VYGGLAALACSGDSPGGPRTPDYDVRVFGSGLVDLRTAATPRQEVVQHQVNAWRDRTGWVDGWIESTVTLHQSRTDVPLTFTSRVHCLLVVGRSAWIGATVTSRTSFATPGEEFLLFIRDLGGVGSDVMHGAFARDIGNVRCLDQPSQLTETVVTLGDYVVGGAGANETSLGGLVVNVSTTGGFPSVGYVVVIGGFAHPIPVIGRLPLGALLPPGIYSVRLANVDAACTVSPQNPAVVRINANATATLPFVVECPEQPSTVRVITRTTGASIPESYRAEVWWEFYYDPYIDRIGANDTLDVPGRRPGEHWVFLSGVPDNCRIEGGTWRTVRAGPTSEVLPVTFAVSCGATASAVSRTNSR
jgi:hypothetical protein